jgi:hypothetical protein
VIYILDADSLAVVDSIPDIGYHVGYVDDMALTPDGQWLFTTGEGRTTQDNLVRKINVFTKETVATLQTTHRGRLTLLDGGRLLRWGSYDCYRDDLELLSEVESFPAADSNTSTLCRPGCVRAGLMIAGGITGENRIRIETVRPRTTVAEFPVKKIDGTGVSDVYAVALHPGYDRVSAIVRGGGYWFIVIDVATGQTIYQHALTLFLGEIAVNSAGTIAVVTDPGRPWIGEYVGTADIVDLVGLQLLNRFGPDDFDGQNKISQIAFTSDEKSVILAPIRLWGIGTFHRIDLSSLVVTKSTFPLYEQLIGAMVLARRTKEVGLCAGPSGNAWTQEPAAPHELVRPTGQTGH